MSSDIIKEDKEVNDFEIPTAKYKIEQLCFIREGQNVYEVIVRRANLKVEDKYEGEPKSSGAKHKWKYFVHYLGWNSRWDKWVAEDELSPDIPPIRALAEQQKKKKKALGVKRKENKLSQEKDKKRRELLAKEEKLITQVLSEQTELNTKSNDAEGKSRKLDNNFGGIKTLETLVEDWCQLPFTLKTVLIDDREKIKRMGMSAEGYDDISVMKGNWKPARMLHLLPASINVSLIMEQFVKIHLNEKVDGSNGDKNASKTNNQENVSIEKMKEEKRLKKFSDSLTSLFDEMLPKFLLYEEEKKQFLNLIGDPTLSGQRICEIYGGEFLLRMIVRLPGVITSSIRAGLACQRGDLHEMGENLSSLINFLQKNRNSCLKGKYSMLKYEDWTDFEREMVKEEQT